MYKFGIILVAVGVSGFLFFSGCSSKKVQSSETTTTSMKFPDPTPTPTTQAVPVANQDYTAADLGASSGGRGR